MQPYTSSIMWAIEVKSVCPILLYQQRHHNRRCSIEDLYFRTYFVLLYSYNNTSTYWCNGGRRQESGVDRPQDLKCQTDMYELVWTHRMPGKVDCFPLFVLVQQRTVVCTFCIRILPRTKQEGRTRMCQHTKREERSEPVYSITRQYVNRS